MFDTTGNNDFCLSCLDEHTAEANRIQTGATPPVHRYTGNLHRPSGAQEGHPGDIYILSILVALSHNDLVDACRGNTNLLNGGVEH